MLIRINLLPEENRPRSSGLRFSLSDIPWRSIGIGAAGCVVVYSGWLFFSNWLDSSSLVRLTAQWEGLAKERAHLQRTEATLAALQNRSAVLKSLKAEDVQWAPKLNLLSDALVAQLWLTHVEFLPSGMPEESKESPKSRKAKKEQEKKTSSQKESTPAKSTSKKKPQEKEAAAKQARGKAAESPKSSVPARKVPVLVLKGCAVVTTSGTGSPVARYLQRLKEHPQFRHLFSGLELKSVEHRQIQQDDVSDFVILLYPKGL